MVRPARTIIVCTRCGVKDEENPERLFARRTNGRFLSWCRNCKREYDRLAISRKRRLTCPS